MEDRPSDAHLTQRSSSSTTSWALLWISVLGLFLEMMLIRWISTEIRIFAYLQNTILVVCFLGLGLGCFTCRKPIRSRQALVPLLILTTLLALPLTRRWLGMTSNLLGVLEGLLIWDHGRPSEPWLIPVVVLIGLGMTYLVMVLVLDMFVPIGRMLGRLMDDHPRPVWAYSVNVAGSLLGTWLFVILSSLQAPPFVWFLVLGALALPFALATREGRAGNLVLLGSLVVLSMVAGWVPGATETAWSPYQKLVLARSDRQLGDVGD